MATEHLTEPRVNRIMRVCRGVFMAGLTDGTYAVGRTIREGAPIDALTVTLSNEKLANEYFEDIKNG